jgi:S-adenosylmethionine synthetase
VLPKEWLQNTRYLIKPTGRFVIVAGQNHYWIPTAVLARTAARAFSGKDPARWTAPPLMPPAYVAKNIVAADWRGSVRSGRLRHWRAQPMNITVYTEGTGVVSDEGRQLWCRNALRLAPQGIIQMLDLLRPIYEKPQRMDTSAAMSQMHETYRQTAVLRGGWPVTDLKPPSGGFNVFSQF